MGPRPKALKNGKKEGIFIYVYTTMLSHLSSEKLYFQSWLNNSRGKGQKFDTLNESNMMLTVSIVPKQLASFPIVPIVQDELFGHRRIFFAALGKKKNIGVIL